MLTVGVALFPSGVAEQKLGCHSRSIDFGNNRKGSSCFSFVYGQLPSRVMNRSTESLCLSPRQRHPKFKVVVAFWPHIIKPRVNQLDHLTNRQKRAERSRRKKAE